MKKELILDVLDAQRVSDGKYVSSWVELEDKDRFIVNKLIYIEFYSYQNYYRDRYITDSGYSIKIYYIDCSQFDFENNKKLKVLKTVNSSDENVQNEEETRKQIFSDIPIFFEKITDEGELFILKSMIEECTEFVEK